MLMLEIVRKRKRMKNFEQVLVIIKLGDVSEEISCG
jgi:hypothetical protein